MNKRKTEKEIKKDLEKVRKLREEGKSIRKISAELGVTEYQVRKCIAKITVEEKVNSNEQSNAQEQKNKKVVLDASVTGIENLKELLDKKVIFVLTSITIAELDKLQKFNDKTAVDARNILSTAAENAKKFECVLIDETQKTPDDCIIKYCAEHKDKVCLITSDKVMTLYARMYGVETEYVKQPHNQCQISKNLEEKEVVIAVEEETNTVTEAKPITESNTVSETNVLAEYKTVTLTMLKQINDGLFVTEFDNQRMKIQLFSKGLVYSEGCHEVHIGDDLYMATKKDNFVTFAHYKVINLKETDNAKMIFSKRISDKSYIKNLQNSEYKTFLRDFFRDKV